MINKLNNMIKFTEYDHLQPKQKPTSRTEIGGFAVLEGLSVKELVKLAAEKTGMSRKELKEYTPKELKRLIGVKKDDNYDDETIGTAMATNTYSKKIKESLVFEKKASPKQVAARKRFMDMINSKKKKPEEVEKKKNESLISEKASDKQLAARKRFMEMISKKGSKTPDVVSKKRPVAKKVATRKKIM